VTEQPPIVAAELPVLELSRATFDALVAHAWSDFPYEVCGLIGLRRDGSAEVIPIRNAERSMRYYVMDSKELLRGMRRIEDEEMGLVIYHPHPSVPVGHRRPARGVSRGAVRDRHLAGP